MNNDQRRLLCIVIGLLEPRNKERSPHWDKKEVIFCRDMSGEMMKIIIRQICPLLPFVLYLQQRKVKI